MVSEDCATSSELKLERLSFFGPVTITSPFLRRFSSCRTSSSGVSDDRKFSSFREIGPEDCKTSIQLAINNASRRARAGSSHKIYYRRGRDLRAKYFFLHVFACLSYNGPGNQSFPKFYTS